MGGTTITIQKDNLLDAINELIRTNDRCNNMHLWLNSITIAIKNTEGKYDTIGNEGIEMSVGIAYSKEKIDNNIVIFAHFGK